jgi:carbon-monoxide dehydrogenase small subunit
MNTQPVEIIVNGEAVRASVEPRMHLGDFVRRELGLTGTHLSCEHGVCGACTVLVDGQPQRSCITFAVACGGSSVTTIEGYGDDPVMAALRRSFHEHHALQCGYCTPGMLCTARDIVLRLPGPDARRVRHELAGNLCRCTGYVGIVEAIDSVLAQKAAGVLTMPDTGIDADLSTLPPPLARQAPGHAVSSAASAGAQDGSAPAAEPAAPPAVEPRQSAALDPGTWTPIDIPADGDWIEVRQALQLPLSADEAWRQLCDLPRVARCLPGAEISRHAGDRAEGLMNIKFGPVTARFAMRAELGLDHDARRGAMRAEGVDQRSATRVKTLLDYTVGALPDLRSKVDLTLRFRLAGPLAQFSRTGLVSDYVAELTRMFGANLEHAVSASGRSGTDSGADTLVRAEAGAQPADGRPMRAAASPSSTMRGPSLTRILLNRLLRWLGLQR